MQRKFIREEPDEARAQRAMYDHFKIWTRRIYPTGVSEEDWAAILEEDTDVVV